MYGKVQASGLTETIPFISTSATWGPSRAFHIPFPQQLLGAPPGEWKLPEGRHCSTWAPSWLRIHIGGLDEALMTVPSLFVNSKKFSIFQMEQGVMNRWQLLISLLSYQNVSARLPLIFE